MSDLNDASLRSRRNPNKLRSNHSGNGFGSIPKFDASEENWAKLELAIGCSIEDNVRIRVEKILTEFLWWSTANKSSPLAQDVQQKITEILTTSKDLRKYLNRPGSDAGMEAHNRIASELESIRSDTASGLSFIAKLLRDLEQSCSLSLAASQRDAGALDEFDCWDGMIVRLTNLFAEYGLPTGAAAGPKTSRFVSFISEMQNSLDKEVTKRGQHSPEALAKAINRARKAHRDRRIAAKRLECPDGTIDDENEAINVPSGQ